MPLYSMKEIFSLKMYPSPSSVVGANHHRLGNLTNSFLIVLEVGKSKTREAAPSKWQRLAVLSMVEDVT